MASSSIRHGHGEETDSGLVSLDILLTISESSNSARLPPLQIVYRELYDTNLQFCPGYEALG
jgi:hypothetical protein